MKPLYKSNPIASLDSLAAALGISKQVLLDFAANAESKYTHFDIAKANGKPRHVCSPDHDLKIIQKRINREIFGNVIYPDYLFGGINNKDYVLNATYHSNAEALVAIDIRDFYPNITSQRVFEVFKYFCNFPDPVADLLTKLTTLMGAVPQGACTSSHLANLVFYDTEHRVVREFRQRKFQYSRLLDDICISAPASIPAATVTKLITKVHTLLQHKGFKIRANKTRVTSAKNPKDLMEVTGLWLNRGRPRVRPIEREQIRTEMRRCEKKFAISCTAPDYHEEYNRVSGKISKLSYLKYMEADIYRLRLSKIQPKYDQGEINRTMRLVGVVARTHLHDREKYSFVEKYYQVMYRISIVARSDASLARRLRLRVAPYCPTQTKEFLIYGKNA